MQKNVRLNNTQIKLENFLINIIEKKRVKNRLDDEWDCRLVYETQRTLGNEFEEQEIFLHIYNITVNVGKKILREIN